MTDSLLTCSIDAPSISPELGTRLLMALSSHVLYAKGQVPFPVGQLASIPVSHSLNPSSRAQAIRQRDELLGALNELEGQLSSALMKLSWTLAVSPKHLLSERESTTSPFVPRVSKVHLMVLLGPSVGAPKLRTIVELDRFEVRPFGWREDLDVSHSATTSTHDRSEDGVERASGIDEDTESISSSETLSGAEDYDGGASEEYAYAQSGTDEESDDAGPEADAVSGAPIPSTFIHDRTLSSLTSPNSKPSHLRVTPKQHTRGISGSPQPELSPSAPTAVNEDGLKKAERALYRTLAHVDTDDDNDEELPTTTMFLLLRAPRSFHHPHWIPRQDYSRSLDLVTRKLLQPSYASDNKGNGVKKFVGGMRTGNVRGVRISCQVPSTLGLVEKDVESIQWDGLPNTTRSTAGDEDEANEIIWWQWEGKVKGIGDDMFI